MRRGREGGREACVVCGVGWAGGRRVRKGGGGGERAATAEPIKAQNTEILPEVHSQNNPIFWCSSSDTYTERTARDKSTYNNVQLSRCEQRVKKQHAKPQDPRATFTLKSRELSEGLWD